jgi:hypothetical protein
MVRSLLLVATLLMVVAGCRAMSGSANPDQNWLRDLERADSIILRTGEYETRLSDHETIARLANIYANANWKKYWHTLPSNLGDRTIGVYMGDVKLRHLSYTGVLWESKRYDSNRTASLSQADCEWIELLFDTVPTGNNPNAR